MAANPSENAPDPICVETLQLKNQLGDLAVLSDWVADVSARLGLSQKLSFRLDLVLTEAVTNIIENAYGDGADHTIALTLNCNPQTVEVLIVDDGIPFDPLQHPDVVLPTSLAEAQVGGLGIHLIRSYAQRCDYQRLADENHFTIVLSRADG